MDRFVPPSAVVQTNRAEADVFAGLWAVCAAMLTPCALTVTACGYASYVEFIGISNVKRSVRWPRSFG